jgi:hypothetical protein
MTPAELAALRIRIKPLVWTCISWAGGSGVEGEDDDGWEAKPLAGCVYNIDWYGGDEFRLTLPDDARTMHTSRPDAQAFAEADHAARICAQLEVAPDA